ncbi:MAG: hypothetical protein KAU36_04350, partial [candidate division Zixibacteria bacterium]|nr:hypothetical protein [candidate division Zixibacteria bacterium]
MNYKTVQNRRSGQEWRRISKQVREKKINPRNILFIRHLQDMNFLLLTPKVNFKFVSQVNAMTIILLQTIKQVANILSTSDVDNCSVRALVQPGWPVFQLPHRCKAGAGSMGVLTNAACLIEDSGG